MLTVLVERGVGGCKSDNVTGERGEGVGTVLVYGNEEDLSVGYVCKVVLGVVNALVVVGGCIHLLSRKELAVCGSAYKNEITVLKLGNESPL